MIRRLLVALAVLVGVLVLLGVALSAFGWLHTYRNVASSMEPTLHCGGPNPGCEANQSDRFATLAYHLFSPGRGDIVAVRVPPLAERRCGSGGIFVKRIVGLPGERWEERNGMVFIDGKPLVEPYVHKDRRDTRTIRAKTIPKGQYLLLGDNRASSCDSREWGTVGRDRFVGKLVAVYWPLGRIRLG